MKKSFSEKLRELHQETAQRFPERETTTAIKILKQDSRRTRSYIGSRKETLQERSEEIKGKKFTI